MPVDKPALRLEMAEFEEQEGQLGLAGEIYDQVVAAVPQHVEAMRKRILFEFRLIGSESAFTLLDGFVATATDGTVKGVLTSERARLMMKVGSS